MPVQDGGSSETGAEARCETCRQYLNVCGHGLPFAERVKSQHIDKSSLKVKR